MDPIKVTVERREFRLALSGPAGANTVLALEVGGVSYPAVVKEMQRHPIRRTVNHIDFLQVNMNEEITVHVAVRLEGEAKAVAAMGGLVDPAVDHLEVSCTPTNMPNEFVIDITDMQPDTVIRLSDIPMPTGVTALGDPDMAVVTVLTTAAEVEAPAATAEGEEGEAEADAAAPAAGDSAE
jgi:large subunit ribosomal protein L25